jgi:hypothetical protein
MTIHPAIAVRSFGILTACALGLLVSYASPAASASSTDCSTSPHNRITTCFLDLTKTPANMLNGGIFIGTSADLGTGRVTSASAGLPPSVSIQPGTGGQRLSPNNGDMGILIQQGSVRLGDIAKVSVCDTSDERDRREVRDQRARTGERDGRCERYYEFLLDANERADGVSLDEFKVLAGGDSDTSSLRYDMDGGPGGDVSVLTNNNPDGNDLRALIPASSFAGLTDDTFVYVYSTFNGTSSTCQEGSRESPCPAPASGDAEAAAVPVSPTALLLGIGLVGMVLVRRRRSPDLGVSD